jgi:hypothetical protein
VERIDFQLANFHQILGESIRSGTIKHARLHRGRLTSINDNYMSSSTVDQYLERSQNGEASGGFIVGHAGRIQKKNGSQITLPEAEDLLSSLHFSSPSAGAAGVGHNVQQCLRVRTPSGNKLARGRLLLGKM